MKFVELGTKALRLINAIGQGVGPSGNDMQVAYEACQDMIDGWAAQRLTIFQTLRKTFPLIANKGGPDLPYTVGPGGDFDIPRPIFIPNANLIWLTTTPVFEQELDILEPGEYAAIAIKNLASGIVDSLYFDGKFDTTGADVGLGDIFLYPVPNGQQSLELALYLPTPMTGFADIGTTDYTFPNGYAEALKYQLAKRLCIEFGKSMTPEQVEMTISTFAVIQRPNAPVPGIRSDWGVAGTGAVNGTWNWRTGSNTYRGSR